MTLRFRLFITLVLVCLAPCVHTPTWAQSPAGGGASLVLPPAAASPVVGPPALPPPPNSYVQISNRSLFPVYPWREESGQERAAAANLRLAAALRGLSGATTDGEVPTATAEVRNGVEVLLLNHQYLLTVTDEDADRAGQTPSQLADVWANSINMAYQEALREQQPTYLRWAAVQAIILVILGGILQGLLWFLSVRLGRHLGWPVQTLLWCLIAARVIDLFPVTRSVEPLFLSGVLRPVTICLLTGLPAAILVRIWGITLRRVFPSMPEHLSSQDLAHRSILRRVTLARVAEVTGATLIWFVAVIIAVTLLGINLGALLTSAGLIGVALGFVAQDSVRDVLGGIYILVDDRFGVGDTIQVGTNEGRVERLNLRVTQLRDMSGRLITISNRNATDVANLTARWAQVDFKIGVSYYDDLQQALDLLKSTALALAEEWPERVLDSPELLGVDSFNDLNIQLRLTLRTPPGDQWAVARELRARIKRAFDTAGIAVLNNLYIPANLPATHQGTQTFAPPPAPPVIAANGHP